MAEKAIHEMISSFAAGCMDKQNFEQFKEYINSEGELPASELGELQNVISLLPIILELEKPDAKLKDKLAKKLIGMQAEIKEKIRLTHHRVQTTPDAIDSSSKESVNQEETFPDLSAEEEKQVRSGGKSDEEFLEKAKYSDTPPPPTRSYELPPRSKKDLVKKEKMNFLPLWIAIVAGFVILLGAIGYVYLSGSDYKKDVTEMESRINSLEGQLNTANNFVDEYQSLIEFINLNDVKIISLSSAEGNSEASGKLFISFERRRGLLELNQMPSLSSNQAFQVWLINDGKSFSAGTYIPRRDVKYLEISDLPSIPNEQVDLVRVTIEPADGSPLPQGQIVLFGSINSANANGE